MSKTRKQIWTKVARKVMMEAINALVDVVASTMGAKGRNVILGRLNASPTVVNDGVTIAKEIAFQDPVKSTAAELVKNAAIRTNDLAGDGTTGAMVLTRSIVAQGWQAVEEGANPIILRRELENAKQDLQDSLFASTEKVETKERAIQIASVSVQDAALGEQIGSTMYDVGPFGAVAVKDSLQRGVFIEKDGGMRIEGALTGGVVENAEKWETKFANVRILILQEKLEEHEFENKWIPFMKQFAIADQQGNVEVKVPNFLVIAEHLPRRVVMNMNQNKNLIKWAWFRPSTANKNMKEIYKDIQSLVGGKIVYEEDGVFMQKLLIADLGEAESASCSRHELVLTVSAERTGSSEYLDRVNAVKLQIDNAEDEIEQKQIEERFANLTGGVATIKVAAATDQDTYELKLRIEDAVNATRAAMLEGFVSGGGVALHEAAKLLKGLTQGEKVLKVACSAALRQILENAGYENIEKAIKELKNGEGYNVLTSEKVDMKKAGIVDPLKVIRLALDNAVSVAGLLLTSEYVVTEEESEPEILRNFLKMRATQ